VAICFAVNVFTDWLTRVKQLQVIGLIKENFKKLFKQLFSWLNKNPDKQ